MATKQKNYKTLALPEKYVPKKTEEYMCEEHKAYFYKILIAEKKELEEDMLTVASDVNLGGRLDAVGPMDEGDMATLSIDTDLAIKLRQRKQNLLAQIDAALSRLEDGTYGYSVISGDEIGLKRLMVRPVATLTMEEKEASEK